MIRRCWAMFLAVLMLFSAVSPAYAVGTPGAETGVQYYAEGATIWLPDGVEPTQEEYPVDTARGDQWVPTQQVDEHYLFCQETHAHTVVCPENCDKLHTHGDGCYGVRFTCTTEEHTHGGECYTTLWSCNTEETSGHAHTDDCYGTKLVCQVQESQGHVHSGECPSLTDVTLTCTLEEAHAHTETCQDEAGALTCDKKLAHAHTETCRNEAGELVCGLDEQAEHIHGDSCRTSSTTYSCGVAEGEGAHTHGDGCYGVDYETLTCTLNVGDGKHIHAEKGCISTQTLVCTRGEHVHTVENCENQPDYENLVCQKDTSHVCITEGCAADCAAPHHTEACYGKYAMWGVANSGLMTLAETDNLPIHFFIAEPGEHTDPLGDYVNYKPDLWGQALAIEEAATNNTLKTSDGIRGANDEADITRFVDTWPTGVTSESLKNFGSIKIGNTTYIQNGHTVNNVKGEWEIKWVTVCWRSGSDAPSQATRCYCDRYYPNEGYNYDHIHIDGILVKADVKVEDTIKLTKVLPRAQGVEETFTFKMEKLYQDNALNPQPTVNTGVDPITLQATIAGDKYEAEIVPENADQIIEYGYYKVTEDSNSKWSVSSIEIDAKNGPAATYQQGAVYVYVSPSGEITYSSNYNGPYVSADEVKLYNQRDKVTVSYTWSGQPKSFPYTLPQSVQVEAGGSHAVNTTYPQGYRVPAGDGYYYTFSGWTTATEALGKVTDLDPARPGTLSAVNSDTVIHGSWVRTDKIPERKGEIEVTKTFDGLTEMTQNYYIDVFYGEENGQLVEVLDAWSDGTVDKTSGNQVKWTIKLPVSESGTYVLKEHNYTEPGYTVTASSQVRAATTYLKSSIGTDTITVEVDLPLNPDNQTGLLQVGAIDFTNAYVKNVATANSYPTITVYKYRANTEEPLAGAEFSLTPLIEYVYEENGSYTEYHKPANDGEEDLRSEEFVNQSNQLISNDRGVAISGQLLPGAYELKETKAPSGYVMDTETYYVYVMLHETKEELKQTPEGEKFVTTTYYDAHVGLVGSKENHPNYNTTANALIVYNTPIRGGLAFKKAFTGIDNMPEGASITLKVTGGPDNINELVVLSAETRWEGGLNNLKPGTYTVTESNTSIHGFNWQRAAITVNGENAQTGTDGKTITVEVPVDVEKADVDFSIAITNTYTAWTDAEFFVHKVNADNNNEHLNGAIFALYEDSDCTEFYKYATATDTKGEYHFGGLDETGTYYLKELSAPDGYVAADTIWEVEVTADTTSGSYDVTINSDDFTAGTDTLKVANTRKTGTLTIKKAFDEGNQMPEDLKTLYVEVIKPDNTAEYVALNLTEKDGVWSAEGSLPGLTWGEYKIQERGAAADGYELTTTYSYKGTEQTGNNVTVTIGANNVDGKHEVTVTNKYVKNKRDVHNKAFFEILKLDAVSNEPLTGAIFQLYKDAACQIPLKKEDVDFEVTATTEKGFASFRDIYLKQPAEGDVKEATYYLKETAAPDGYDLPDTVWKVRVSLVNGEIIVDQLNKGDNFFEDIFNWVVGVFNPIDSTTDDLDNGVLLIQNSRKKTTLTVKKAVKYMMEGTEVTDPGTIAHLQNLVDANEKKYVAESYSINTTINNGTAKTASLAGADNPGTVAVENAVVYEIGYKDTWSVEEVIPEGAYFNKTSITANGEIQSSGTIALDENGNPIPVEVVVTNTYVFHKYDEHDKDETNPANMQVCLDFVKKNSVSKASIGGAGFTLYQADMTTPVQQGVENGQPVYEIFSESSGTLHFHVTDAVQTEATAVYYLVETTTPAGFAENTTPIQITVTKVYDSVVENGQTVIRKKLVADVGGDSAFDIMNVPATGVIEFMKEFKSRSSEKDVQGNSLEYTVEFEPEAEDNVKIVLHVHGPVERDGSTVTSGMDKVQRVVLTHESDWEGTLDNLPVGEYLIHEAFASVHGYTWDNVYYGQNVSTVPITGEYADDYVPYNVTGDENADKLVLNVTNQFTTWKAAEFYIRKIESGTNHTLSGADFTLYSKYENKECSGEVTLVTGDESGIKKTVLPDGRIYFSGFTVDDTSTQPDGITGAGNSVTYYLKETTAPNDYKQLDTVWAVTVKHEDGAYDLEIKCVGGTDNPEGTTDIYSFNHGNDTLTVANEPYLGSLTITKQVTNDSDLQLAGNSSRTSDNTEPIASVSVKVSSTRSDFPDQYVQLNAENNFSYTVGNLRNGTYTVEEVEESATRRGYILTTTYQVGNDEAVTNAPTVEIQNGATDSVTVYNKYVKDRTLVETDTELEIYKTDDHGAPLENVTFGLYEKDAAEPVYTAITDAKGIASFDDLKGNYTAYEATAESKTLYLKEITPTGYNPLNTVWTVTIKPEGDHPILDQWNETTGLFQTILTWIKDLTGDSTNTDGQWSYDNGRLTVKNTPVKTSLILDKVVKINQFGAEVTDADTLNTLKAVKDADGKALIDSSYTFNVSIDNGTAQEVTVAENPDADVAVEIEYNSTYTVDEIVPEGALYTKTSVAGGTGVIAAENLTEGNGAKVTITNTYEFWSYDEHEDPDDPKPDPIGDELKACLVFQKIDENGQPLKGAEFALKENGNQIGNTVTSDENGIVHFDIQKAGTYTLEEITPPTGYAKLSDSITVTVTEVYETGTKTINGVETPIIYNKLIAKVGDTVVNSTAPYDISNSLLTTKLTVSKTVKFLLNGKEVTKQGTIDQLKKDAADLIQKEYDFHTNIDGASHDYALADGGVQEFTVKYGDAYSVAENMDRDANYTMEMSANAAGTVGKDDDGKPVLNSNGELDEIAVNVVNTYSFWSFDNHVDTGVDPIGETLETCLVFKKVDRRTEKPLAGATFGLYKGLKRVDKQTTDETGLLHFHVSEPGEYVLKELSAPSGYDKLSKDIKIKVTETYLSGEKNGQPVLYNKLTASVDNKKLDKDVPMAIANRKTVKVSTWDNPRTGDFIMVAVAVMVLTGAMLTVLVIRRKKFR